MKNQSLTAHRSLSGRLFLLEALLALASVTPAVAQELWRTVDVVPNGTRGKIVADAQGNIFTLGRDTVLATNLLRRSADQGATWTNVGTIPGVYNEFAGDSAGYLYVAGNLGSTPALFRSRDQGNTWSNVFVTSAAVGVSTLRALAIDRSNHIYVVMRRQTDEFSHWQVMKGVPAMSAPHGLEWSRVDLFRHTETNNSFAYAVLTRPAVEPDQPDVVFVGGRADRTGSGGYWTVRKSVDGGARWTTVMDYQRFNAPFAGWISALAVNDKGDVYAAGLAYNSATETGMLVRKSIDGGDTWSDADYVALGENGLAPSALAVDRLGRVFVAGTFPAFGSSRMWAVRGSVDGGTTWTTVDTFLPSGAASSDSLDVASDAYGNVYVAGRTPTTGYLRMLPAPDVLQWGYEPASRDLRVSWPVSDLGFLLQSATTLSNGGNWTNSSLVPQVIDGRNVVTSESTGSATFFRLRQP